MSDFAGEVRELEGVALRGWPAAEVFDLDGWKLRHSSGVTRRGNSVWAGAPLGQLPLEARVERAERFYCARGLTPLFQITAASEPEALDRALEQSGYEVEAPVSVQVAAIDAVAANAREHRTSFGAEAQSAWLEVQMQGRFADAPEALGGFLARLGERAVHGVAFAPDGTPASAVMIGCEPPWGGVFSMLTAPAKRGQGAGAAVLAAAARAARERGCTRLYLQVERDNPEALRLYARAGFVERYGYHYRRGSAD